MRPTRRALLRGTGLAAVALAAEACSALSPSGGSSATGSTSPVPTSSQNPFGVLAGSSVQLLADTTLLPATGMAALVAAARQATVPVSLGTSTTTSLASDVATQLATSQAPDLVVSGGEDQLGIAEHATQLADLTSVVTHRDARGETLAQRLRPGVLADGTIGRRVVAVPATWSVHGLWYSATLLERHGWQAPATMDDLATLGAAAKNQGLYLFCWGRENATAYLELAVSAAVKEGGHEVRRQLDSLASGCWRQAAVQEALDRLKGFVSAGYVKSGGSTRSWKDAATAWSRDRTVLFVPAGSWITAQLQPDTTFGLTVSPDPALSSNPQLGSAALHAQGESPWSIPSGAKNAAGAREVLALAFDATRARQAAAADDVLSTLTDAAPSAPSALQQRQLDLLSAAGSNVYGWRFVTAHGATTDFLALWNAFLEGDMDVATLTTESQRITDLLRADPAQAKYAVA